MGGRPLAASSPASRGMGASRVATGRPRLPSPPRLLAVDRPGGAGGAAVFPILIFFWGGPPGPRGSPRTRLLQCNQHPTQRKKADEGGTPGGHGGRPTGTIVFSPSISHSNQ